MTSANATVQTTLRIPIGWSHPQELLDRMPAGFVLKPESLTLPDGTEIEMTPLPPDEEFAAIFQASCRRPATPDELATVRRYTANITLTGPGGSLDAARTMMRAGASIVQAGGAGVFIDNSALAHGGGAWIEMAEDGSPDALSFAFVSIFHGERELSTLGMHLLGFPDLIMRRTEGDADTIIEVIRYVAAGEKPVRDGHILADDRGRPRFSVTATAIEKQTLASPMENPFGRLRLTSVQEIAESN